MWGGGSAATEGATVTASQLIYRAMRDLGVLRAGQGGSPDAIADGLATLNDLLDSWNTERLVVHHIARDVYDLTAGESTYYLGDGGGALRPVRIEHAGYTLAGSTVETPIDVLTVQQWAEGRAGVYNDAAAPVATLYVRPTPTGADQLALYTWSALAAFDLDTPVSLAPGYSIALRFALAATLAPSFAISAKIPYPLIESIEQKARTFKAAIKSANITPIYSRPDSALLAFSDGRALFS
jgi:hypothetical protein